MTRVVIATHNQGKVAELRLLLAETAPGVELVAYDGPEPVEDGETFAANALIKARAAAWHTGLPALADDSGISAAALGGAPGIHSARYAGTRDADDNIDKLLAELDGAGDRSAWFSCVAALVVPPPAGADGADPCAGRRIHIPHLLPRFNTDSSATAGPTRFPTCSTRRTSTPWRGTARSSPRSSRATSTRSYRTARGTTIT